MATSRTHPNVFEPPPPTMSKTPARRKRVRNESLDPPSSPTTPYSSSRPEKIREESPDPQPSPSTRTLGLIFCSLLHFVARLTVNSQ
jgi:hypothetical protein